MSHLPENKDAKNVIVDKLLTSFEEFKHIDDDGVEIWLARELAPLLGYKRWENFEAAIGRAQIACGNVGEDVEDHFRGVTKMVDIAAALSASSKSYRRMLRLLGPQPRQRK